VKKQESADEERKSRGKTNLHDFPGKLSTVAVTNRQGFYEFMVKRAD